MQDKNDERRRFFESLSPSQRKQVLALMYLLLEEGMKTPEGLRKWRELHQKERAKAILADLWVN